MILITIKDDDKNKEKDSVFEDETELNVSITEEILDEKDVEPERSDNKEDDLALIITEDKMDVSSQDGEDDESQNEKDEDPTAAMDLITNPEYTRSKEKEENPYKLDWVEEVEGAEEEQKKVY